MSRTINRSRRTACLFAAGMCGLLGAGCGGAKESSSAAGAPGKVTTAPPPLVDSRGNPVAAAPGGATADGGHPALAWAMPAGWISETPSSSMRQAQYSLPAAPGDAAAGECAVFYFGPGQGGEVQANIDRWAAQFTSPSGGQAKASVTETTVAGMKVHKVELQGTYNPSPMMGGDAEPKPGTLLLGAIVEGPDAHWFFKCTGPAKTMEAHRREFDDLVGSVHTHS